MDAQSNLTDWGALPDFLLDLEILLRKWSTDNMEVSIFRKKTASISGVPCFDFYFSIFSDPVPQYDYLNDDAYWISKIQGGVIESITEIDDALKITIRYFNPNGKSTGYGKADVHIDSSGKIHSKQFSIQELDNDLAYLLDAIELDRYFWYDFPDYWDHIEAIESAAKKEAIDAQNFPDDEHGNRSPFVMHQISQLIMDQYGFALQIGTIDLRFWKGAKDQEPNLFPRYFILRKQGEQIHFKVLPSLDNAWLKKADWDNEQTLKLTFTYQIPNLEKGKNKKRTQKMFVTVDEKGIHNTD